MEIVLVRVGCVWAVTVDHSGCEVPDKKIGKCLAQKNSTASGRGRGLLQSFDVPRQRPRFPDGVPFTRPSVAPVAVVARSRRPAQGSGLVTVAERDAQFLQFLGRQRRFLQLSDLPQTARTDFVFGRMSPQPVG